MHCLLHLQAIWFYGLNLVTRWRYRHIPGPPPAWMLGNAREMQAKMVQFAYQEWAQQYGPIFRVFVGMQPIVVVTGAES